MPRANAGALAGARPTTAFGRLARAVLAHPRLVLLAVVAALAASVVAVSFLGVDSNLLALLPQREPEVRALVDLESEGGGLNLVTIAVRGDDHATDAFLSELQDRLRGAPDIRYVLYELDPRLAWRIGLLQLGRDELASLRDRLKGALALGPAAANPFVSARLLDLGPMTERLRKAHPQSILFEPGGIKRLLVRPDGPPQDIRFARTVMAEVHQAIADLDPASRGVEVLWVGGSYRHNVEDYEGVVHDMKWTGAVSFLLVLLLLALAFRDPHAILLIFLPLGAGTLLSFGWAAVTVRRLNTFTGFFGAVLIGLGIDFSIHLYSRYREERPSAPGLELAVVRAWDRVGPPCMAAALTTAGGFLALVAARFRGFSELGFLLASGVMICLGSVLVLLPLLIVWRESRPARQPRRPRERAPGGRPSSYRLAPVALLLLSLVTLFGVVALPHLEFEYDLSELRRDGAAFGDLTAQQRELVRSSYAPLVMTLPDEAALDAADARYRGKIQAGELPEISQVLSVRTLIPADQDERLEMLREISRLTREPDFDYLPAAVRQNLVKLADSPLDPLQPGDLPASLRDLLGASDGGFRLLLMPSGNMWDLRQAAHLRDVVRSTVTEGPVAGQYLALGTLYRMVRKDAPRVSLLAAILVALATALDLRRPRQILGALAVLSAGMLWAAAAVAGLRVKLSIVNIVGIPILLGIGVDVVIHLLHRLREEGSGGVLRALVTTGWAAGLSAATTILSFASLVFASSRGIRSLGMLVVVGLSAITLAAFALLPVGWMTTWKLSGGAPGTGASQSGSR